MDHGTAFGRIAFACPRDQVSYANISQQYPFYLVSFYRNVFVLQLPDIEGLMKKEKQKILTPLVSLDTPGKATVEVVILADPVSLCCLMLLRLIWSIFLAELYSA